MTGPRQSRASNLSPASRASGILLRQYKMQVSRRDFICSTMAGAGAVALGLDVQPLVTRARTLKTSKTIETFCFV